MRCASLLFSRTGCRLFLFPVTVATGGELAGNLGAKGLRDAGYLIHPAFLATAAIRSDRLASRIRTKARIKVEMTWQRSKTRITISRISMGLEAELRGLDRKANSVQKSSLLLLLTRERAINHRGNLHGG